MLFRNKRGGGYELKIIVSILIISLTFFIIVYGLTYFFGKAERAESEELCRAFNLLMTRGGEVTENFKTLGLVPQACKVLQVDDVPENRYVPNKEGAKKNVADLVSKCWWMNLEGKPEVDVLGHKGWAISDDECFVCYTFNLDKKISFSAEEFSYFLDTNAYTIKDESDQCAALGGGKCLAECNGGDFVKEISSNKCGPSKKCCVAKSQQDVCINKGGKCTESCGGEYGYYYPDWTCSKGSCCIKRENFFTYRDYVQKFDGPGYLALSETSFNAGEQYAVVFTEDSGESLQHAGFVGGFLACMPWLTGPLAIICGLEGEGAEQVIRGATNEETNMDGIFISKYSKVEDKCALQSGASG